MHWSEIVHAGGLVICAVFFIYLIFKWAYKDKDDDE
jgi:hypothetical protein